MVTDSKRNILEFCEGMICYCKNLCLMERTRDIFLPWNII